MRLVDKGNDELWMGETDEDEAEDEDDDGIEDFGVSGCCCLRFDVDAC